MSTQNQDAPIDTTTEIAPMHQSSSMVIALLAGETSGDMLGASLMLALRSKYPDAQFVGIGGPLMIQNGLRSLYPMERLSVMGFVEPLKRLPELLKIRRNVVRHFRQNPPALFIGIDSPDFNLGIEKRLKAQGIKTMHYVSPSVWAWRQGRIKKIKAAVDHMLCLLPFEAEFYVKNQLPVTFVGHPMADEIDLSIDKIAAKQTLGINDESIALAILPGSRAGEIKLLAPLFLKVAKRLQQLPTSRPLEILIPAASESAYQRIKALILDLGLQPQPRIFLKQARDVLAAADVALVASGTVTLECMLMKTPMVVAYRLENMTYAIAKRLVNTDYISLPNLLAQSPLVSEYVQDAATEQVLFDDLEQLLMSDERRQAMQSTFTELHKKIRLDASESAAEAVQRVLDTPA